MKLSRLSSGSDWTVVDADDAVPKPGFFSSLEHTLRIHGEIIASNRLSRLVRVCSQSSCYYVKVYREAGKGLRRFFGRSRVRAEWENLQLFSALHIPTAPLVAYGEERALGVFRRGAVVTQELGETLDLERYTREYPERLHDRDWLYLVLFQVARYTRRLHDHGFTHNDLNWRNILISMRSRPRVFFIDCPSGRRWRWPFLKRRIMKDLAHLDKKGRERLSRSQRLAFYKIYRGIHKLSAADKAHVARILAYGQRDRQSVWQRILPPMG